MEREKRVSELEELLISVEKQQQISNKDREEVLLNLWRQ